MEEFSVSRSEERLRLQGASEFLLDHFREAERRGQALAGQIDADGSRGESKSWEHFVIILRGGHSLWREYRQMLINGGVQNAEGGLWSTSESSYRSVVDALVLAWEINDDVLLTTLLKYDLPEILSEWRELVIEGKRGLVATHGASRDI